MPESWKDLRAARRAIFWCILVCASVRLALIFLGPPYRLTDENISFDDTAWNLATRNTFGETGQPPMVTRTPFYSFLVSLVYRVFGHRLTPVFILQTVASCLMLWFVYQIAQEVFQDRRIGLLAIWLIALFPGLIGYTKAIKKEVLLALLLSGMVLLLIRSFKSRKMLPVAGAGILLGLINLTRPIMLLFPFWFLLWIWALHPLAHRQVAVRQTFVLAVSAFVTVFPWTLRNHKLYPARWIPVSTDAGVGLFGGNWPPNKGSYSACEAPPMKTILEEAGFKPGNCLEPEEDHLLVRKALEQMAAHPFVTFGLYMRKIGMLWLSGHVAALGILPHVNSKRELIEKCGYSGLALVAVLKAWSLLLLALTGVGFFLCWKDEDRVHLFLAQSIAYYTFFHAWLLGLPAYMLPVWSFAILYAAYGIFRLFPYAHAYVSGDKSDFHVR